jgi:hypothetical protein
VGAHGIRRGGGHLHDADVRARAASSALILGFACGCALSSVYGFLSGTWPFGVVEAIWAGVALNRFRRSAPY